MGPLLRDAHLGIARADAEAPLGEIDGRVRAIIELRMEPDPFDAEDLLRMKGDGSGAGTGHP